MFRYRTHDDRGRPTRVRWWEGRAARAPGIGRAGRLLHPAGPLVPLMGVALLLGLLVWLTVREGPFLVWVAVFSPVASTLIFVVLGLGLAARAGLRRAAERARVELLQGGRCPSCLYDFGDIPPEPDGLHTCPECAAAWDITHARTPEVVVVRAFSERA